MMVKMMRMVKMVRMMRMVMEDGEHGEDDEDAAQGGYEDFYHFKDKDDSYVQLVKPREHRKS